MSRSSSGFIFLAALVAVTLAVYLPSLGNELVFDDGRLTDGTIFGTFGSLLDLRPRMLSYGSFVWLKSLLGDDWWKQRLVNVVLHIGVAGGLYALFTQLLQVRAFSDDNQATGDFIASRQAALRVGVVLFALNPVAVYAVAYLVQRSIVMAALFVVLACIAWVRGLVTGRYVWMGAALLCVSAGSPVEGGRSNCRGAGGAAVCLCGAARLEATPPGPFRVPHRRYGRGRRPSEDLRFCASGRRSTRLRGCMSSSSRR